MCIMCIILHDVYNTYPAVFNLVINLEILRNLGIAYKSKGFDIICVFM